jgi:hypothetical protein
MQATSAQNVPNQGAGLSTVAVTAVFVAGAALGAFAGIAMAPKAAPLAITQSADDFYAGPHLGRGGVKAPVAIQVSTPDFNRSAPLRWHRYGEINVAALPDIGATPTGTRYEVVRGK